MNHVEIMFFNIVLFLPILKQSFGKSVPILETKNLILNNGHKMPFLGFSTFNWKASPSRMKDAVYEAIKIGYRYKLFSHTVCELLVTTAKLSSLDTLHFIIPFVVNVKPLDFERYRLYTFKIALNKYLI